MYISRREPRSLFDLLHRDVDQVAGRHYRPNAVEDSEYSIADWVPAVDIIEEKDRFVLRADVPGVKSEDIDVNMENGVLSVSGERRHEATSEVEGVRRTERRTGKFFRRFSLPDSANPERVTARIADGILEVIIPKQAEVMPRRITVESA